MNLFIYLTLTGLTLFVGTNSGELNIRASELNTQV